MNDYYDQTPEQRRQLRAQRNRRRQAQVRRRKLLLGLLVLAVLAVVLILVLRGCGKDKEPAQPTPSENVDKPDTPDTSDTPTKPSDKEPNQKPDDQKSGQKQEIPWNLTLVNRWNPLPGGLDRGRGGALQRLGGGQPLLRRPPADDGCLPGGGAVSRGVLCLPDAGHAADPL